MNARFLTQSGNFLATNLLDGATITTLSRDLGIAAKGDCCRFPCHALSAVRKVNDRR